MLEDLEAKKASKKQDAYLADESVAESRWEEKFDEERKKKYWVHRETGEISYEEPKKELDEMTTAEQEVFKAQQKREEIKGRSGSAKKSLGGGKKKGKK